MPPMKRPAAARSHPLGADLQMGPETVTIAAAARRWRVTRYRVRQLLSRGELPFIQICGEIRIPRDAIDQWEQGGGQL
jgi:excisionase family DNA binding protein